MKRLKECELRIGNQLLGGKVVSINSDSFTVNDGYQNWTSSIMTTKWINEQPIPLTEELLLRCGFELTNTKRKQYFKWVNRGRKLRVLRGIKRVGYRFFATSEGFYFDCQYLHQLQNLYWILCGEELNI